MIQTYSDHDPPCGADLQSLPSKVHSTTPSPEDGCVLILDKEQVDLRFRGFSLGIGGLLTAPRAQNEAKPEPAN